MRAIKAKILRAKLGFKPGEPREYSHAMPVEAFSIPTVVSKGARSSYQRVKRTPGLAAAILKAV